MVRLNILDELRFKRWYDNLSLVKNKLISPDPDDPLHFYDYRKAFLSGVQPSKDGHLPSQFKIMGHPRAFLGGYDTKNLNESLKISDILGDFIRDPRNY